MSCRIRSTIPRFIKKTIFWTALEFCSSCWVFLICFLLLSITAVFPGYGCVIFEEQLSLVLRSIFSAQLCGFLVMQLFLYCNVFYCVRKWLSQSPGARRGQCSHRCGGPSSVEGEVSPINPMFDQFMKVMALFSVLYAEYVRFRVDSQWRFGRSGIGSAISTKSRLQVQA
jgi:hypothetical protein